MRYLPKADRARKRAYAAFQREVRTALRSEAEKYGVSRNHVIEEAVAYALGVKVRYDSYASPRRTRGKRRNR